MESSQIVPHVLLVDEEHDAVQVLAELLHSEGCTTSTACSLAAARESLWKQVPDVVLTGLTLPDGAGIDLLDDLQSSLTTELAVVTGDATIDSAVEAIQRGAVDYLTKPIDVPRLRTVLTNATRTRSLRKEVSRLRGILRKFGCFGDLVGLSPAMQQLYDMITKVAPSDATVLVLGESGTGKELVARSLHEMSRRANGPFITVNCGAIAPNLIESELFGHERGSFTGAERTHRGYFERASGGTLFLDEIAETPAEFQVKLLRVLETATLRRVGGETVVPFDARVIAATNRDPHEEITQGNLREDLFYRLNVFALSLPPLRERGEDVVLLAQHFLDELNHETGTTKHFDAEVLRWLRSYDWPGNVRELKNAVKHACIMATDVLVLDTFPEELREHKGEVAPDAGGLPTVQIHVGTPVAEAERQLILATLDNMDGNKERTAKVLGISVKTLYNRLKKYAAPLN